MKKFVGLCRALAGALACLVLLNIAMPMNAQAAGTGCLPGSIKAKLAQIRAKFGPVRVISTHRPGARVAGTGKRSLHASCRAVDFHPPRGKYRQVVAFLRSTHGGGLGTYSCGMSHIHLDNGPRVRFHKCVSKRGKRVSKRKRRKYASYKKRSKKRRYYKKRSKRRYGKKRSYKKRYSKLKTSTKPQS